VGHDEIDISLLAYLQGGAGACADVADPNAGVFFKLILQGPTIPASMGLSCWP